MNVIHVIEGQPPEDARVQCSGCGACFMLLKIRADDTPGGVECANCGSRMTGLSWEDADRDAAP